VARVIRVILRRLVVNEAEQHLAKRQPKASNAQDLVRPAPPHKVRETEGHDVQNQGKDRYQIAGAVPERGKNHEYVKHRRYKDRNRYASGVGEKCKTAGNHQIPPERPDLQEVGDEKAKGRYPKQGSAAPSF